MADTTIDSLVVKLGLDASDFQKGAKEVGQELDNARKTTDKTARDISASGKRAGEFFGQMEKAALKFFAAITVGRGLSDFTRAIIQSGAQLDRMAGYLGTSADSLSRWQGAVRQSGGTADGLMGTMQGLSSALTELRLTGTTGILPFLQSLQVSLAETATGKAKPLEQILLDISDAVKNKIPKGDQYNFMKLLGIDDGTANLLLKNRTEIENLLNAQKAYSDADAKSARQAQENWEKVKLNIERTTQDLIIKSLPTLERMAKVLEKFATEAVPVLITVGDKFVELDKATNGWSTSLVACLAVLRLIGGPGVIGGITKLAGALSGAAVAAILLRGDESESTAKAKILTRQAVAGDRASAVELARIQLDNQWWRKIFNKPVTDEEVEQRATEIQRGEHGGDLPAGGTYSVAPSGMPGGQNQSRAERNNNPGNLEFRGQSGATPEQGEGRFARFDSAEAGVAALTRQLQLYGSRGVDTIEKIITKYAPPSENNTTAYINAIVNKLRVPAAEKLDLNDPEILSGLIQGISRHEAGRSFLSDEQVMTGINMAGVSTPQAQSTPISIGEIKVYTQATDATGIARDIRGAMVRQADSGVQ
jgi:hypothetical protein